MKRYAWRKDDNHSPVEGAFRELGAGVYDASADNAPYDLIVWWRGQTIFVEIKDGDKPPSHRKLTPKAVEFHDTCTRHGGKVVIVKSVNEAIALLGGRVQ
jgi:hypothetical protein